MADAPRLQLLNLVRFTYMPLAGTVKSPARRKETSMTPAAFTQTDVARDSFVAPRREEGALRIVRSPRRSLTAFGGDAQTPLFHAWRP